MNQKGQVATNVLMWGAGILIAGMVSITGYFSKSDIKIKEDTSLQAQRIMAVETTIKIEIPAMQKQLESMDGKLNLIMAKQGIRYVEPVATTK